MKGTSTFKTLQVVFAILLVAGFVSSVQAQVRAFEAVAIGTVNDLGGLSNDTPVRAVGQRNNRAFLFVNGEATPRTMTALPGESTSASFATAISADGAEAVGVSASRPSDWPNPIGPSN